MTVRRSQILVAATLAVAAAAALGAALLGVKAIETRTAQELRSALRADGLSWARVTPDGTRVHLGGTAPDEAARFRALSAAGRVLDSTHVLDEIAVTPSRPLDAPRFGVELLRNEGGISVIGLIPQATGRAQIVADLEKAGKTLPVTEMVQIADHPVPEGWQPALDFAMRALAELDRAKISISAGHVAITAVSDSPAQKARIERSLTRATPNGVKVTLDISAPRPVIAPFTLRFRMDGAGARFDACAADTEAAAARILDAARQAGMAGPGRCPLGLGAPSGSWGRAAARGIAAVADLGGGTLTFSNADVSLIALPGTDPQLFDRVAAELEADLPDGFALTAIRPDPEDMPAADQGPREFTATLSPEGLVQLRGRAPDDLVREAAQSYARARFGRDHVHAAMRLDPGLPEGWPLRILAGLEALAQLRNGAVIVTPDRIALSGLTMDEDATARATRILTDRLGEAAQFEIDITYREPPARVQTGPTPDQCVAQITDVLARQKIVFAPGSTRIEGAAVRVVDQIADILRSCPDARIEIGGHTDSQGREEMNQALSQQRADAVLTALIARRVLTSNLSAKGYGESQPIADNATEEGREANRRIAFRLIGDENGGAPETAPDADGATDDPPPPDTAGAQTETEPETGDGQD